MYDKDEGERVLYSVSTGFRALVVVWISRLQGVRVRFADHEAAIVHFSKPPEGCELCEVRGLGHPRLCLYRQHA